MRNTWILPVIKQDWQALRCVHNLPIGFLQLPHSNTGGQFGDQRPDGYEGVVKCLGFVW